MTLAKEQEINVSNAFSTQSPKFDELTNTNPMEVCYRNIIRNHVMQFVQPNQNMLELNCGTGLDAVFFSNNGLIIHAIDNAAGMLDQLERKIKQSAITNISFEKCSFNDLELKNSKQTFDHVFSNYGGLNCTEDLNAVIKQLNQYVKIGGYVHFVMIAPVCIWELATVFKGKFKFAFRRLKKGGAKSHLEGHYFMTYYYSSKYIKKSFGNNYKLMQLRSLGCLLPPTFNDYFPAKNPKLFDLLKKLELAVNTKWPFNKVGDLYVISLKKIN